MKKKCIIFDIVNKSRRKWYLFELKTFFLEITPKLTENDGFQYRRPFPFFFFFLDLPQHEAIAAPNFHLPPKIFVMATCLNVMAIFFLNDVIFAMGSQAVQILYATLFLETKSWNA